MNKPRASVAGVVIRLDSSIYYDTWLFLSTAMIRCSLILHKQITDKFSQVRMANEAQEIYSYMSVRGSTIIPSSRKWDWTGGGTRG